MSANMMNLTRAEDSVLRAMVGREAVVDCCDGQPIRGKVQTIQTLHSTFGNLTQTMIEKLGDEADVITTGVLHLRRTVARGRVMDATLYNNSWFIQGSLNTKDFGEDILKMFDGFHRQLCLVAGYVYKQDRHACLQILGVKPIDPPKLTLDPKTADLSWFRGVWDAGIRAKLSGDESSYTTIEQEYLCQIRRALFDAGYIDAHGNSLSQRPGKGYVSPSRAEQPLSEVPGNDPTEA